MDPALQVWARDRGAPRGPAQLVLPSHAATPAPLPVRYDLTSSSRSGTKCRIPSAEEALERLGTRLPWYEQPCERELGARGEPHRSRSRSLPLTVPGAAWGGASDPLRPEPYPYGRSPVEDEEAPRGHGAPAIGGPAVERSPEQHGEV